MADHKSESESLLVHPAEETWKPKEYCRLSGVYQQKLSLPADLSGQGQLSGDCLPASSPFTKAHHEYALVVWQDMMEGLRKSSVPGTASQQAVALNIDRLEIDPAEKVQLLNMHSELGWLGRLGKISMVSAQVADVFYGLLVAAVPILIPLSNEYQNKMVTISGNKVKLGHVFSIMAIICSVLSTMVNVCLTRMKTKDKARLNIRRAEKCTYHMNLFLAKAKAKNGAETIDYTTREAPSPSVTDAAGYQERLQAYMNGCHNDRQRYEKFQTEYWKIMKATELSALLKNDKDDEPDLENNGSA